MVQNTCLSGLYAITPEHIFDDETLMAKVHQAIIGGARLVQYREKQVSPDTLRRRALLLKVLCNETDTPLIINDDVDLAQYVGADGVHLGRDDGKIATARKRLGKNAIIGASCYGQLELAQQAVANGASYVAFGACYPSPSKSEADVINHAVIQQARQSLDCPIVAIGGITPENAAPLLDAGAHMLAIISGIFAHCDVRAAAQRYASLFKG